MQIHTLTIEDHRTKLACRTIKLTPAEHHRCSVNKTQRYKTDTSRQLTVQDRGSAVFRCDVDRGANKAFQTVQEQCFVG